MEQHPFSHDGFVKVELRARSRKRWGWAIVRAEIDTVVEKSAELYSCAEEAWEAGQRTLATLFPVKQPRRTSRRHLVG